MMNLVLWRESGVHLIPLALADNARGTLQRTGFRTLVLQDGSYVEGVEVRIERQNDTALVLVRVDTFDCTANQVVIDDDALARTLPVNGTAPALVAGLSLRVNVPDALSTESVDLVIDLGTSSSSVVAVIRPLGGQADGGRVPVRLLELVDRLYPRVLNVQRNVLELERTQRVETCLLVERLETLATSDVARPLGPANPRVSIGEPAREQAFALGAPSTSFFKDLKQNLHDHTPVTPADVFGRAVPRDGGGSWKRYELAAFFTRELLLGAMEALNQPFPMGQSRAYRRIAGIHLTVPVTATRRERDDLVEVTRQGARWLGLEDIEVGVVCDESTAVGHFLIHNQVHSREAANHLGPKANFRALLESAGATEHIRVMVVDIGGGTTDISVADFGWRENEGVVAELCHVDGMVLGGEDLTRVVAGRVRETLASRAEMHRFPDIDDRGSPPLQFNRDRALRRRFYDLAEALKVHQSDAEHTVELRLDDAFANAAMVGPTPYQDLDTERFQHGRFYEQGRIAREHLTSGEVSEWIRDALQSLGSHIDTLIREFSPHWVVTSGMTSRLPQVGELVRNGARVVRLHEVDLALKLGSTAQIEALGKTAVALGAAFLVAGREAVPMLVRSVAGPFSPPQPMVISRYVHDGDRPIWASGESGPRRFVWPRQMNSMQLYFAYHADTPPPTRVAGGLLRATAPVEGEVEVRRTEDRPYEILSSHPNLQFQPHRRQKAW